MTKEEKVKLQHYVPKVYLKNFAEAKGKNFYFYCFNKQLNKSFSVNIKNIAFEREFYDSVSEEQETEKKLRNIESKVDKIIQKIILRKNIEILTEEEKEILSEFIAYQDIRTKETREEIKEIPKHILEKWGNQMAPKFKNQVINSMKRDSLREVHRNLLGEIELFKEKIKNMKWILIINKSKFPFWTSDNPVARYNQQNLYPFGNIGLESPGIEIHFPISPKISLLICDKVLFKNLPIKIVTKDYMNIIHERDFQVRYSTKFVFSNENNFDFARTMIKEDPKIKDPNRKRLKIN